MSVKNQHFFLPGKKTKGGAIFLPFKTESAAAAMLLSSRKRISRKGE